jgi:GTP-binding protein
MFEGSSATLLISAAKPEQLPEHTMDEIVLVGKSNVGKSSLINALLNRKKLAYVGAAPGKTRLINFFDINQEWVLVDVPGYGYAKMSKTEKARIVVLMDAYFQNREQIKGMLILIDIRREISEDDVMMIQLAQSLGIPFMVVLTKSDKVSQSAIAKKKKEFEGIEVGVFSALKKTGIIPIQEKIAHWLK